MTPIERQILEALWLLLNESQRIDFGRRKFVMDNIQGLLNPKGADEDCCKMDAKRSRDEK